MKMLADFQICIRVPLSHTRKQGEIIFYIKLQKAV